MGFIPASGFEETVGNRYHIYNSLFLNLPFQSIARTGALMPLLLKHCEDGFAASKSPEEILDTFFSRYATGLNQAEQHELFFDIIRYVERQVVLFDSVEDAAFEELNDVRGQGTFSGLLLRAKSENKLDKLKEKLQHFSVRVVLTAHPTQFYPGTVLGILTDLEWAIRSGDLTKINQLLQQLGKTKFFKKTKPTPFEEAATLCWYLENVFYASVADIVLRVSRSLEIDPSEWMNPNIISIGFWPGGDRDGNPFVTNETTWQVATHLHERVIRNYFNEVRKLKRRLTFTEVDAVVQRMEQKLLANIQKLPGAYLNDAELIGDIDEAKKILIEKHDGLFLELLDEFLIRVRIFGFHFASLDIRQHADKHEEIWKNIFGDKWASWIDEKSKIEAILNCSEKEFSSSKDSEDIGVFGVVKKIQSTYGLNACSRYIISNCGSAVQVMEVFQLAKLFASQSGGLLLDVVPLFESIEDLASAGDVMSGLYAVPAYRAHLESRGNRQVIMLGFSDGTKDGGYLRANWSIYRAKEMLTKVSREAGITVVFFDGRGGPPARGGGNTHDFYASLGPTIESEEIQITIQGQTISSNFGRPVSCTYNLEQLLSAGVEQAVFDSHSEMTADDKLLLDNLAEAGYVAYLGLKNHPDFVSYLQEVTPLPYFGETNVGSRPTSRKVNKDLRLEDLRAIPFVGSWAQMKQNIPGFYGVGTAIEKMLVEEAMPAMKDLFKRSLFFRTLLGNSMMSLTKTFYPATTHLDKDVKFGPIWRQMQQENIRSAENILAVAGISSLMENSPGGRASIRLREKIVLPLIAIQQYALIQVRKGNDPNGIFRKLIIRCMFGIINAARNSA